MRNLAEGVDPRIGSSRSLDVDGSLEEGEGRLLQRSLDGAGILLLLPPGVARAVVFDGELVAVLSALPARVKVRHKETPNVSSSVRRVPGLQGCGAQGASRNVMPLRLLRRSPRGSASESSIPGCNVVIAA